MADPVDDDEIKVARKMPDEQSDLRTPPLPSDYQIPIIHRDEEIIVVNKPFDIRIDGKFRITVEKLVRSGLGVEMDKFRLCNQLDAATSGVMVIGLNQSGAGNCGKLFASRKTEKFYLAVCHGEPQYPLGEPIRIDARIFEPKDGDFKMYIDEERGKESETIAVPLAIGLTHRDAPEVVGTLFLLKLLTGRRHQLRLHLKHIGHPIVGDATYAGERSQNINRMMLHAWKLVLPYSDQKRLSLAAAPEDICESWGLNLSQVEARFSEINEMYFKVDLSCLGYSS